jgi:hypothetical protein
LLPTACPWPNVAIEKVEEHAMSDLGDKLDELVATLRTERDELRVRLHLLKAEAKDEWDQMEERWDHLEARLKKTGEAAADSGEEVAAAGKLVAEEIGAAYKRIQKSLD